MCVLHFVCCRPDPPCEEANDPVVKTIIDYCDRLYHLIRQWNSEHIGAASVGGEPGEGGGGVHASSCVASDVRQLIVSWLANRRMVGTVCCAAAGSLAALVH